MPARPGRTSASQETHHIGRIVVHPTNPDIVYVAALGDLWGPNKERGVYKSTDGGATWTQTLSINEDTGVSDIAIDPAEPQHPLRRGLPAPPHGLRLQRRRSRARPLPLHRRRHRTGPRWRGGLPATGDIGRCSLDIYRKNTNIVYAEFEHATLGGVYRSEDKGATWARMSDTNPRPSYFSQIRVDPNNDQKVWLGGVNMYMSEDGGRTFVQTRFRDVHSDVHAIWIDPANSDHIVNGNDGGVWVTWDSGRNWRHLNNIAIGQFYEVAYDFQKPYHVCGGLQDNYSWCGPSASLQTTGIGNEDWITVQGGDGFYARIDPTDANIVYAESQDGNLSRRDLQDQRIEIHPPAGRQRHRAALSLPVEFAARSFRRTIRRPSTTAATTSSNPPIAATPGSASARTSPPTPSATSRRSSAKSRNAARRFRCTTA